MNETIILPGRSLHVLYADDVREEIGGKLSIMGVYQDKLFAPHFPMMLPKLAILMTASTPVDTPFKIATFKLTKGDEIIFSVEINEENFRELNEKVSVSPETTTLDINFVQILPGFLTEKPCVLKPSIETELGTIVGKPLVIELLPTT